MATKKVRIGFIGCGGIAAGHARRLAEIPEAEIVALADPSSDMLDRFVKNTKGLGKLPRFDDWREMLDKTDLDAVEIASPHTVHFEQIMAALDKGLHVLCEKPMVCTSDHAKKVEAALDGKVLVVSYQRRYLPGYVYVKEAIDKDVIGDLLFVSSLQCQDWYEAQQGQWRQSMALSGGGQLNDSGSHMVDILLWMTSLRATEVQAYIDNFDTEVDINSAISIKFDGGALGNVSIVGRARNFWEDISIWGTDGSFFLRNGKVTLVGRDGKPTEPSEDDMPPASNPDRNFIDSILGKGESRSTAKQAIDVIGLTEAAWKSGDSGDPEKVA